MWMVVKPLRPSAIPIAIGIADVHLPPACAGRLVMGGIDSAFYKKINVSAMFPPLGGQEVREEV